MNLILEASNKGVLTGSVVAMVTVYLVPEAGQQPLLSNVYERNSLNCS